MAYLRILRKSGTQYVYIMRSVRKGQRVIPKVLEYLGRDPDPVRLKRALAYWRVGQKRKATRKGGRG
jgi:hypothetical protein